MTTRVRAHSRSTSILPAPSNEIGGSRNLRVSGWWRRSPVYWPKVQRHRNGNSLLHWQRDRTAARHCFSVKTGNRFLLLANQILSLLGTDGCAGRYGREGTRRNFAQRRVPIW